MSPLDRAWKPGFSPDTSVFSALETFVIIALYKSTFTTQYHTITSRYIIHTPDSDHLIFWHDQLVKEEAISAMTEYTDRVRSRRLWDSGQAECWVQNDMNSCSATLSAPHCPPPLRPCPRSNYTLSHRPLVQLLSKTKCKSLVELLAWTDCRVLVLDKTCCQLLLSGQPAGLFPRTIPLVKLVGQIYSLNDCR